MHAPGLPGVDTSRVENEENSEEQSKTRWRETIARFCEQQMRSGMESVSGKQRRKSA